MNLGEILVNGICFTIFAKVFPFQNFALSGIYVQTQLAICLTEAVMEEVADKKISVLQNPVFPLNQMG